jgi:hypothetical protein
MKTMAKAVGLLLAVAFLAGVWQQRYGEQARPGSSSAPFRTAPATRSHAPGTAPSCCRSPPPSATATTG